MGLIMLGSALAGAVLTTQISAYFAPATQGAAPQAPVTVPAWGGSSGSSGSSGSGAASGGSSGTRTSGTRASAAQSAGVVLIDTRTQSGSAAGTGMVLTATGQVLTNYHVVEGSTSIDVTLASTGATYSATVVGHDASRDVALLQLANASGLTTVRPDADGVTTGESVTAVGNAGGQGYLTAASGTVTDPKTNVTVGSDNASGSESLSGVIATDAAAQPGDSGGPMFDAQGEVVGMTTAGGTSGGYRRTASTTAFAIGIDDALTVVNTIRGGQDAGTTRVGPRAMLGVTVQGSGTGSSGGSASGDGVTVAGVTSGTPAARAGLTTGDTITALNGRTIASQADLSAALELLDPGQRVTLTWVDASGNTRQATLTLAKSLVN